MMNIPYRKQTESTTNRKCGAAAIEMVLAAFNIKKTQKIIWKAIRDSDQYGTIHAKTFLVCK